MKSTINKLLLPLTLAALVAGCASSGVKNPSGVPVTRMNADEQGFVAGTGVESQDLVAVTDKMARSVLSIPQIAGAVTPPRTLGKRGGVMDARVTVQLRDGYHVNSNTPADDYLIPLRLTWAAAPFCAMARWPPRRSPDWEPGRTRSPCTG